MPTKQGLFLKRLFYDTPAITVIFVIIMVAVAGYLFYSKESNNPAKTTAKSQNNQAQTKKITTIPDAKSKEKKKPVKFTNKEPDKNIYSEKELIAQFEENALAETPAIRIRVQKPGHVMFAINRPDLEKLPEIMEQLADLYMDTVNQSNPVTVYFMVGGGVRGVHTFLQK